MANAAADATQQVPHWTFGDRLRKAREHAGLRQEVVAEILGVSPGSVSNWETGRGLPRGGEVRLAQKWSEVTNVPAVWLLGLNESASPCYLPLPAIEGQMELALGLDVPALAVASHAA